ncbi:MAG TPA: DUF5694 domain-containing protein [Ktedonobacteraceae bacterium]|nr:DUF5694 domain-containing protein [Ktedonobacteraceae bacterium]
MNTSSTRPVVLLLGCYHMVNHNLDAFNVEADDMLSPGRQSEIRAVVEHLKRFRPTKVAVEKLADQADALNEQYQAYLSGTFALSAEEYHQLGFRIAAELQHEQIYPINWKNSTAEDLDEVYAYAQSHQAELYDQLMLSGSQQLEEIQERVATTDVGEQLRWLNEPGNLLRNHQMYMTMARIGTGNQYVGIDWVKGWYQRNLIIFANLTRIITSPDDRVLVIYGVGHIPLLTQFIRDSGFYTLETVEKYLHV